MKDGHKDVTEMKSSLDTKHETCLPNNCAVEADITKFKKRERNRVSAYKSRKKHTDRADILHQEYEKLEKENAALMKEIQSLQKEQLHLTKVLEEHESACLLLTPEIMLELLQQPDLWSPSDNDFPFIQ